MVASQVTHRRLSCFIFLVGGRSVGGLVGDVGTFDQEVEGLASDDIPGQRHDLSASVELGGQFLGIAVVGLGQHADLLAQFIGVDLDVGVAGDALQDQVRRDGAHRVVARILPEALLVPSLGLQELLDRDARTLGLLLRVLHPVLGLVVHQRVGQFDLDLVEHRLQRPVAQLPLDVALLQLGEPLAQVVAQLRHRVELAGGLGEVVVGLGQLAGLHVLDQDGHVGGLSGEALAGTLAHLLGDLQDLPRLRAGQVGVELGSELSGAHEVEVVGAAEAFDLLTQRAGGLQVDRDEVAVDDRALRGFQLGEPLLEPGHPVVDLGLGDLGGGLLDLQPGVVGLGELQPGTDLDHRRELQRRIVGELVQVDVGVGDGRQVVLGDRLPVVVGHRGLQELVADDLAADLGVDDLLGHLALAEPGDLDLVGDRPIRLVHVLGVLVGGDLDGELDGVFVGVLDGGLHRSVQATRSSGRDQRRDPPGPSRPVGCGPCTSTNVRSPAGSPTAPRTSAWGCSWAIRWRSAARPTSPWSPRPTPRSSRWSASRWRRPSPTTTCWARRRAGAPMPPNASGSSTPSTPPRTTPEASRSGPR